MENNKNKKSVKFQGDVLNFCDFIQVFVFTTYHHLKCFMTLLLNTLIFFDEKMREASHIFSAKNIGIFEKLTSENLTKR